MNRKKLTLVLVFSSCALLAAVERPAAAMSAGGGPEIRWSIRSEMRALFEALLSAIRPGSPATERPAAVVANAGADLDPDGLPKAINSGLAGGLGNEAH